MTTNLLSPPLRVSPVSSLAMHAEPGVASDIDPRAHQLLAVLAAVAGPLTLRELHRQTQIPVADLAALMANLRVSGRIRRLHTVIESYRSCVATDSRI